MQRACVECGTDFQAKRASAKYCSSRCRVRTSRKRQAGIEVAPATPITATFLPDEPGRLTDATREELAAHGLAETADGILLLTLAARIDAGAETSPALASLSKEYAARKEALLPSSRPAQVSPMDELRALRERRRTG